MLGAANGGGNEKASNMAHSIIREYNDITLEIILVHSAFEFQRRFKISYASHSSAYSKGFHR